MNQWKWVNQFQPQTLYIATILCYVDAVFGLLFGGSRPPDPGLVVIARARRRRLRHRQREEVGLRGRGRSARCSRSSCCWSVFGTEVLTSLAIISFLFDVALVALLLHPMSREYQRIWFK